MDLPGKHTRALTCENHDDVLVAQAAFDHRLDSRIQALEGLGFRV